MGGFDEATWQALGLVLTIVGLALSIVVWSRRGAASGLRGVAWSLLPLAAGLTGVLRLAWEVTDSVVDWAARLVFSPVVWLGIAVAGLSLVLFVVSGLLRRRAGTAGPGRASRQSVGKGRGGRELPRRQSAPPAEGPTVDATGRQPAQTSAPKSARKSAEQSGKPTGAGDDMKEIEDILRRHGIS
jgi:heme exporter protein D